MISQSRNIGSILDNMKILLTEQEICINIKTSTHGTHYPVCLRVSCNCSGVLCLYTPLLSHLLIQMYRKPSCPQQPKGNHWGLVHFPVVHLPPVPAAYLLLQSLCLDCLAHLHHHLRHLLLLSEQTHFLFEGTDPRVCKQLYIQENPAVH